LTTREASAAIFFLLLAIAPLIIVGMALVRSRLSPLQCVLWVGAYLLCRLLWRTRWLNELPLHSNQGGVIVCNHRSSVDPFFVQTATGRKIHWMVAREYCEHPAFARFLSACEVIPVSRGGVDTAATKAAIRLAGSGELVGMLPEGRINMSDDFLLPARPGAALVAIKAGVPIVPCYVHGAPYRRYAWSPLLMPASVEVRFGQPLWPPSVPGANDETSSAETFILDILKAIADLAGRTSFQPQLAGPHWKPTEEEIEAAASAKDQREAHQRTQESQLRVSQ
jgi:1-acyl-sn-glycerol-3-phosphate acyltransferase